MNEFFKVEIPLNGFQEDILSGMLHSEGCIGIHETTKERWQVYFDDSWIPDRAEQLVMRLKMINPQFDEENFIISNVPFQDWNKEWKKYFKPIEPAVGIWIRPPWEKLPVEADGIEIIIDPQMAFGTGHHETTALMIRLMNEMSFGGKRVLDVGTGSGILAIIADKLGAKSVMAIDNDSDAIANAKHNFQLNQIGNIDLRCSSIGKFEDSKFDIVLANIDSKALSSLASRFHDLMQNKGNLIVSGILTKEAPQIESLYTNAGLTLLKQQNMNEWTAMHFSLS